MVTITTADGKVYTDPSKIKIPRNEKTELFYHILENFVPQNEGKSQKTAEMGDVGMNDENGRMRE